MYIFVRMTIHIIFWMGFRHAHLYTNDYTFSYWFSSCTSLYGWLSMFLCVFVMYISVRMTIHIILVWVFFMYISVGMTIHILMGFRHVHLCTNDYKIILVWFFRVCNSLQRVNSMVQWRIINDIIMYMGFYHVCNALQRVNSMVKWRIIKDIIMYISFEFWT